MNLTTKNLSEKDKVQTALEKLSPEEKTALTIKIAQKNLETLLNKNNSSH